MHEIRRNLQDKIKKQLDMFAVVVILGIRQSGKTTVARLCCPDWTYFDLENDSDFELINGDPDFFFQQYPDKVIIDEAQRSESFFRHLRGEIDKNRDIKGRFLLTGSSSFKLLRTISESLAGRVGLVELAPLKMNEFEEKPLPEFYSILQRPLSPQAMEELKNLGDSVTQESVFQVFINGGFPEPLLKKDLPFQSQWFENYYKTYIERDIRYLFPRLKSITYRRFIGMLAHLSGTIINRSDVGRSLDVSEVTIKEYLDIAEGTYLWRNIPSYGMSRIKTIVKMPKGIFRDSGLAFFLNNIQGHNQVMRFPLTGNIFEAFIIEEILRGFHATMSPLPRYNYYRTRSGVEIDLILEGPSGIIPIEIKFGSNTRLSKLTSLKRFVENENLPLGIVINNGETIRPLSHNIIQIPAKFI